MASESGAFHPGADAPEWTPTYTYHGVANTFCEDQLVGLILDTSTIECPVSEEFTVDTKHSYREFLLRSLLSPEELRVRIPGIPNHGIVSGVRPVDFTVDDAFLRRVLGPHEMYRTVVPSADLPQRPGSPTPPPSSSEIVMDLDPVQWPTVAAVYAPARTAEATLE